MLLSNGAWCGTVGRRTDPDYWRIYDKGVEQRTHAPGVKWRLELEAKGTLAPAIEEEMRCSADLPRYCFERVTSQWTRAGFSLPLDSLGGALPTVRAPKKPESDMPKLALWLCQTVAPVIRRMLRVYSEDEVLAMLGLSERCLSRTKHEALRSATRAALVRRANMAGDVSVAYQGSVGGFPPNPHS